MTQGYNIPAYNPETKQHYIDCVRDVKIIEARVNEELPDELFQMNFEEGIYVADRRSGKTVTYKYIATPPSVIGKPLPDFENIRINFNPEQAKGRMLLVCFWDMNQRPSRNCITRLAKQAEQLNEKGIIVVAMHATKVGQVKLNEWVKKNNIPFPVGIIQDDGGKIRFKWGVKSLPWLILTNKEHVITAEGFNLLELNAQLESK